MSTIEEMLQDKAKYPWLWRTDDIPLTPPEMLWELLPRASHILPRRIFRQCMDRLLSGPEGLLDALAAAWLRKERDDT